MRKLRQFFLTTLVLLCSALTSWAEPYGGTSQTPVKITESNYTDYGFTADNWQAFEKYYGIRNAAELYGFAEWVNKGTTAACTSKCVLTADIVVNEGVLTSEGELNGDGSDFVEWIPIGTSSYSYQGTFDGNGHTISGLYFNNPSTDNVGLFGNFSGKTAVIRNVGVYNSYFYGKNHVGGIAGDFGSASIINCFNAATVIGNSYVGGIAGGNVYTCTITSCFNSGKITGSSLVGGINGSNKSANYSNNFVLTGSASSSNGGTFATAEEFASGKVAYLLMGSNWYQNLNTPVDAVPVLDPTHAKVWFGCGGIYVNDPTEAPHSMVDGICSVCGYINVPTLIDAQAAETMHISTDFIGYYAIANTGHLYWFADKVNDGATSSKGVLIADIVVNEDVLTDDGELNGDGSDFITWTPIGKSGSDFAGIFEGNGHTISGLYCNTPSTDYVGLFGSAYNSKIKNLGVIDSYFSGKQNVGGISGYEGYITNCYNEATVVGSEWCIGGICGNRGTITDCYNIGNITGSSDIGGISGCNAQITKCYNAGTVTALSGKVGGISGSNGRITKCYNIGNVTSSSTQVGGIVGYIYSGTISSCYNTGTITGKGQVGGICGYFTGSESVSGCYNIGTIVGQSSFQSICGVNNGEIINCVYLSGSVADREAVGLTSAEFASGKATFILNGSTSDGDWYQTIREDNMPVWDDTHKKVYGTSPCSSEFSNDENNTVKEHDYHSGICSQCGEYEPATLVEDVYQIANVGQLYWFANLVNGGTAKVKGELTDNIVVNENVLTDNGELNGTPSRVWTPIGTEANRFKGTFNGNNHTVSGLYADYGSYIGLFGYANNATISNVGVIDSYFSSGGSYIGGICGYAVNTTINLCYNEGFVKGHIDIGGICGYLENTTISNCYNIGAIASVDANTDFTANVGGIYGFVKAANYSYVRNCYNAGTVRGGHRNYCVGSIGGNIGSNTRMTNCFYLVGSAVNWSSVVQNGIGSSSHTDPTADVAGKTDPFNSIVDVRSGRLTYLLNGSVNGGTTCYQIIGTDERPTWDDSHSLVYESSPCPYSNNPDGVAEHHYDEFGQCTVCGYIKQPTLVTEENYNDFALGEEYIGYYAIGDAIELLSFAAMVNEGNTDIKGVLVDNIEANSNVLNDDGTLNGIPSREWTPIGTEEQKFAGIFDGNNHTVRGLYLINDVGAPYPTGGNYIGLVGYASGAVIMNVGILDSYFYGNRNVGGICGGAFEHTEINNCYSKGTISGDATIGGVCGYAKTSNITHCYNIGIIDVGYSEIGGNAYVGGVVGATSINAIVSDCYNAGSIISRRQLTCVGGIDGSGGIVSSCYNVGSISGIFSVGAICGTKGGTQSNCFYLEGCAIDENRGVQNGIGFSTYEETTTDEPGITMPATTEEFANGKIGYLLNANNDTAWHQNLFADAIPVLDATHNNITGYVEEEDNIITVYGNLVVASNYVIAEGKTLLIPADATVTTTGNAVITNNGTIIANGSIAGNDLAGNGSFIYNVLGADDVSLAQTSFIYKGAAFTLDNDLEATISTHTLCDKIFTFDNSKTSVSYENNRNVGDNATVTWTNTNSSTVSKTFSITPKTLTISNITAANKTYDGNEATTVSYTADVCEGDIDYVTFGTAAAFADKNAGTGKTVSFNYTTSGEQAGNYAFATTTGTTTANIEQRELVISSVVAAGKVYDGNETTTVAIEASNIVSGDKVEFGTVAAFADKNVGTQKDVNFTYTKSGDDADNYKFASTNGTVKADIKARELTLSDFAADNKVYDGTSEATGSFADDRVSGDVLEFSYTVEFADENAANNKAVSFSGIAISGGADKDNYSLVTTEGSATADITPKEVSLAWSNTALVYNGENQVATAAAGDLIGEDACTVTAVSGAQKNAGTYTATASELSNANYKLPADATSEFTIAAKEVSLVWSNTSLVYNGENQIASATAEGLIGEDACTVTVSGAQTNAGTYTATATALSNDNYKLPSATTSEFSIEPKEIGLAWSNTALVYNGENQIASATAEGLVGEDVCTVTVSGEQKNAGTYTATATALSNDNYKLPATATSAFTIAAKEVSLVWSNTEFVYNGENQIASATAEGLIGEDACTVTVSGAEKNAGTHTATATALSNDNYKLPTAATSAFTIAPKEVSLAWSNTELVYNGAEQAATATAVGLISGDECTVTVGGKQTNVGTYTATATALSNANYKLPEAVTSEFSIAPKTGVVVTITENSSEVVYNTNEQKVEGYTFSINDELGIYSEDDFSFSGNAVVEGTTVGTYPMELSAADFSSLNTNYADVEFVIVDGALTITKAAEAPNKPAASMETRYINTQLVALPENWKWAEYAALVEGDNTATANYDGSDKGNYVVESVAVSIKRLPCQHNQGNELLYTLEPTCTHNGYTGNLSCKLCGEIYEYGDSIPALGHAYDTVVVAATCTTGGYKELTCSRCGDITHIDVVPATGHTAGEPVVENYIAPTCTEAGTVDTVVYCTIDTAEISRVHVVLDALGHKADSVVKENVVAATYEAAGSYELVTYCSVCGAEISRDTVVVPQLVKTIELEIVEIVVNQTNYTVGDSLNLEGGKIVIATSDSTTAEMAITPDMVSGFNLDSVGVQTVTIKVVIDSVVYITTFEITVKEAEQLVVAQSVKVTAPTKVEYKQGEALDVTGGKLTVTFSDNSTKEFDLKADMISGFDADKVGEQKLTVSYTVDGVTLTATFSVTVTKEDDNTAIDEVAAEISIYAYSNVIVVESADALESEISIFDVNGRMVAKELAAGTRTEIRMSRQGVYIVKVGDAAKRVLVY